jgi:hypothetical protein
MTDQQPGTFRRLSAAVIALVLANVIPLYGVLALGWEVFPIMLLFWMENLVVGGFNVLKMLLSEPQDRAKWLGKLFLVPFFCFHYGMFTLIHGVFVLGFFGQYFRPGASFPSTGDVVGLIRELHLGYAVLALVASHAFSFGYNYLWRGEFRTSSLQGLMQQPYGRVVVLHLAILGGGFLIMALKSPTAGLVLLVALKIILDVRSHWKEHRVAGQSASAGMFSQSSAKSTAPPVS